MFPAACRSTRPGTIARLGVPVAFLGCLSTDPSGAALRRALADDGAIVDTVGAGDAFGGAFLARWIERGFGRAELVDGAAMRDAIGLAIEVARLTVGRRGADPPYRHEVGWPPT